MSDTLRASLAAALAASNPILPIVTAALQAALTVVADSPADDQESSLSDNDGLSESSDESVSSVGDDDTSEIEFAEECTTDGEYQSRSEDINGLRAI